MQTTAHALLDREGDGASEPFARVPSRLTAEELFAREHAGLRAFCRSLLGDDAAAEDVVQEAFVRVAPRLEGLSGNPAAYLVVVVRNLCMDELRARGCSAPAQERVDATATGNPEDAAVTRLTLRDLWRRLSADDRRALAAHAAGIPLADIADRMGVTVDAAAQRVSRARRRARGLRGAVHGALLGLLPVHRLRGPHWQRATDAARAGARRCAGASEPFCRADALMSLVIAGLFAGAMSGAEQAQAAPAVQRSLALAALAEAPAAPVVTKASAVSAAAGAAMSVQVAAPAEARRVPDVTAPPGPLGLPAITPIDGGSANFTGTVTYPFPPTVTTDCISLDYTLEAQGVVIFMIKGKRYESPFRLRGSGRDDCWKTAADHASVHVVVSDTSGSTTSGPYCDLSGWVDRTALIASVDVRGSCWWHGESLGKVEFFVENVLAPAAVSGTSPSVGQAELTMVGSATLSPSS